MPSASDAECHRLRQLLEMQTELLAGVAHELNTPLNSIIGFSELLVDMRVDGASSEQTEFLNHILTGGRQLATLTRRLGDLTNLSSQRPWRVQPLNLETLLADVAATLRMALMRRRVALSLDVAPALSLAYGDEVGIKQVVYTLLWSAIRVTREGQGVVLRVTRESPEMVRLEATAPSASADTLARMNDVRVLEDMVRPHGGVAGLSSAHEKHTLFALLPLGS